MDKKQSHKYISNYIQKQKEIITLLHFNAGIRIKEVRIEVIYYE